MRIVVGCFALLAVCSSLATAQQPARRKQSLADTTGGQSIRLYFSPIRVDSGYRLTPNGYSGATHVEQNIVFGERKASSTVASVIGVPSRTIDTWNGVEFVSPALAGPFELSGEFSGRLELISNTQAFDFKISLYELTSSGDYILISSYSTKETAIGAALHPMSLQTGIRQYVDYRSGHFASREIQNGSRLLVLITLIGDANAPLTVGWYGDSYIDLAVRHR